MNKISVLLFLAIHFILLDVNGQDVEIYPLRKLGWHFDKHIYDLLENKKITSTSLPQDFIYKFQIKKDSIFLLEAKNIINEIFETRIHYPILIKNTSKDTLIINKISYDSRTSCNCDSKIINPLNYLVVDCYSNIPISLVFKDQVNKILEPDIRYSLNVGFLISKVNQKNLLDRHYYYYHQVDDDYLRGNYLLDSLFNHNYAKKNYKKDMNNTFKIFSDSLTNNYTVSKYKKTYSASFKFMYQNTLKYAVDIDSIKIDGENVMNKHILKPEWISLISFDKKSKSKKYSFNKLTSIIQVYYSLENGESFFFTKKINFINK